MMRAVGLTMTILAVPMGLALGDTSPDPGANAALKYWQAFAKLPKVSPAEQKKLEAESPTLPLDAHAREIVTRSEYALQMMHYAAAQPYCDWGMGYEEGIGTMLPHLEGAGLLSSVACLRARLRFEEGRNAEAIQDIMDALTLSRHVTLDGVNIMLLWGYSIENRVSQTLALYLPKLNAETIKDLKTRLDALPKSGSLAEALRIEEKCIEVSVVRKVKGAKDKESLLAFLTQMLESEGRTDPERGRAFLHGCGGTADGVIQCAEKMRQSYGRMAKNQDLPLDQFVHEWEAEVRKQAGNPVFKELAPFFPKMRWFTARAEVRRALLSAALAVQRDGPDALKTHPDPVVGSPFEYAAFKSGFELRSTFKLSKALRSELKLDERSAQPLTITVGLRGE
jgi:hypothetical protein